ncbi:MAG: DnaT-like ssDNA-binding protein [Paracoccus hibiscisoli]|uniref:DnaT-like ssDNA-binding protein n=1 Tax=Paracoccus hibiscisoli TaxID=2023261 RepID=UPI00391D727C
MLSFTEPVVTETDATAYIAAGGATGWPADATLQRQAIMRGQRYVAARFNGRWRAAWPEGETPEPVKLAVIEAAILEARKPGALSPVSTPATDKVLVGVGKVTWERVGDASAPDAFVPRVTTIEGLLAGLIWPTGSGAFLRTIG